MSQLSTFSYIGSLIFYLKNQMVVIIGLQVKSISIHLIVSNLRKQTNMKLLDYLES